MASKKPISFSTSATERVLTDRLISSFLLWPSHSLRFFFSQVWHSHVSIGEKVGKGSPLPLVLTTYQETANLWVYS